MAHSKLCPCHGTVMFQVTQRLTKDSFLNNKPFREDERYDVTGPFMLAVIRWTSFVWDMNGKVSLSNSFFRRFLVSWSILVTFSFIPPFSWDLLCPFMNIKTHCDTDPLFL
jgi:hypothetical protein